jgi:hypothetical protein
VGGGGEGGGGYFNLSGGSIPRSNSEWNVQHRSLTLPCCSRALFTASNTGLKGKLKQKKEETVEKGDGRILNHVKCERKTKVYVWRTGEYYESVVAN